MKHTLVEGDGWYSVEEQVRSLGTSQNEGTLSEGTGRPDPVQRFLTIKKEIL